MNLKIAFRADASIELGTGHVMRCLTLATALRDQGAECQFISGLLEGNMLQAIQDKGFKASSIAASDDWKQDADQTQSLLSGEPVDWLIVDHYGLDSRWENALKSNYQKLMVIDDLADRPHNCDLLLDQNLGRLASDYKPFLPNTCQLLIGPQYALLRPEFAQWRDYSLKRRAAHPELKHLLISMGGTDYPNSTSQILEALKQAPLPLDCRITVVMGASSPWTQQVTGIAKIMPWKTEVAVNVSNMAELMANSDLAIGAAGSTTWERCCLGLPSLVVILAENQKSSGEHLIRLEAGILLELFTNITQALSRAITDASNLRILHRFSEAASQITSGQGISFIGNHFNQSKIRKMHESDLKMILSWRNHPKIRACMHSQHEISLNEHRNWFLNTVENSKKHLLIFENKNEALGFVSFIETSGDGDADWGFYVSPSAPKGSGKLLGHAALQYGFSTLNLKKIRGEVLQNNSVSQAFHRMLGFKLEPNTTANTVNFSLMK
jgi:UDP-2,4-diacetamido-2,4,6-trideoxy-beta-L-altropyranose hydrolase